MPTPPPPNAAQDVDIIVVGAGTAGLTATKALIERGHSVRCLEAAHRIGGRVHTNTRHIGVPLDEGAHWLHYRDLDPFVDIGHSLGLDMYPTPQVGMTHDDDPDGTFLWKEADKVQKSDRDRMQDRFGCCSVRSP